MRHKKQIGLFRDDEAVLQHMRRFPDRVLIDEVVSFDIYTNDSNWKKAVMSERKPQAYVVVT